ncbi:hypothetical protein JW887_05460 [Candidatus Dojkabacteria bacterium]|nr:hypothetical protein [Candidatus Dojkabacteria bacterium]
MSKLIQTNIFPINNLESLTSHYKLYSIIGLNKEQEDYYKNCQLIINRISRKLRTPALVIERQNAPFLVLKDDSGEPPTPYPLVRTIVNFEYQGKMKLDYTSVSPENIQICLRFLQFLIQAPLFRDKRLWQPNAGGPYFEKHPILSQDNVSVYRGFRVRSAITPNGKPGLCIDVSSKYLSNKPLPPNVNRNTFERYKGKHCVYHFGHQWYDVKLAYIADQNVSQYLIPDGNRAVRLNDYIIEKSEKPIPPELAELEHDSPVVIYKNTTGTDCAAPATLCYPVIDTYSLSLKQGTFKSVIDPAEREKCIYHYMKKYLDKISFGDNTLNVSAKSEKVKQNIFQIPDCEFGNSKVISIKNSPASINVKYDDIGKERLNAMTDKSIGFYTKEPLPTHYFFMPQTVYESYGKQFNLDLSRAVNRMYPQSHDFEAKIIPYDDKKPKTYAEQGKAILNALDRSGISGAYCLVMIHHLDDRSLRQEDPLAAMISIEFRNRDMNASIIHSKTSRESYELKRDGDGTPSYQPRNSKRGRLNGYLRNIALNKILLANHRWPYVLAESLNADVTIGIDVKQNTVGITLVDKNGANINWIHKTSRQKEKLHKKQIEAYIYEILKEHINVQNETIEKIVIHRDGRVWDSEIDGFHLAIKKLQEKQILQENVSLTILEISKTSLAPVRLFESEKIGQSFVIRNPQIGSYYIQDSNEAFICTTGRPFERPGTVDPLHVKLVTGDMDIVECLRDVFFLSSLAWTKPDDCSRYPITIRLADRFLTEVAGDYDIDLLNYFEETKEVSA